MINTIRSIKGYEPTREDDSSEEQDIIFHVNGIYDFFSMVVELVEHS
jgi:hypothetical protein